MYIEYPIYLTIYLSYRLPSTIHTNSQYLSLLTLLTVLYYPLLSLDVCFASGAAFLVAYTFFNFC
jgi:hypothetical protein